jgi:hypothetical protein
MKKLFLLFLISLPVFSKPAPVPAKLRYPVDFIFEKVLEKKHLSYRTDVPFPVIRFVSVTPLKEFQDAIEEQWGMRPDQITNAFAVKHNKVFLNDDAAYYIRTGRCMDDSLAHELTHYVQAKYLNWDLNDESLEWEAIEIQTAFREEYCK